MAIVWGLRLAIMVAPAVYRITLSSGGDLQSQANVIARYWSRLSDPDEDTGELSTAMSSEVEGTLFLVTDFTGSFELRKLQVRFQRTPPGGVIEDVDVCTFHFLKLSGGVPTNTWADADYAALEGYFNTWWTAVKPVYRSTIALGQYRWYASGPAWDVTPAPYNPARRITEVNTPGTSAQADALPPQNAMSVTEKTASRPTWGRFYLPAPASDTLAPEGLIKASTVTGITAATVTLYNAARAANLLPVVFTRARGEYTRRDGTILPAKAAAAHTVDAVQMDNIYDVIRSRRWATVTQRVTTALT